MAVDAVALCPALQREMSASTTSISPPMTRSSGRPACATTTRPTTPSSCPLSTARCAASCAWSRRNPPCQHAFHSASCARIPGDLAAVGVLCASAAGMGTSWLVHVPSSCHLRHSPGHSPGFRMLCRCCPSVPIVRPSVFSGNKIHLMKMDLFTYYGKHSHSLYSRVRSSFGMKAAE